MTNHEPPARTGSPSFLTKQITSRRGDERRDCSIRCRVETLYGATSCWLINVSPSGAGIKVDPIIILPYRQKIRFIDGPLADVLAVLRWAAHPRYGLQFDERWRNDAKVKTLIASLAAGQQL